MNRFRLRTREDAERVEDATLAAAGTRSAASRGRVAAEDPDPWRTAFERDRDRILHSKAFRRLKHKTQVFINPEGDHYVTRLTHTLQVTQIGGSIARFLSLNDTLAEAICLGHDVGHSPFGHTGEDALSEFVDGEWLHSHQSVRVFESLEPLNLTSEVLDGIGAHPWKVEPPPRTPEGMIVRYADRIAYLAHDALDAIRAGVMSPNAFPVAALRAFGEPGHRWITSMIESVVDESLRADEIRMSPDALEVMHELRSFMFERVYLRPEMEAQRDRAKAIIRGLVLYYLDNPQDIPDSYRLSDADTSTQVLDYVAGMTDRFAIARYEEVA